MRIVPAQFQSQPHQVSPMRTPAQVVGGFNCSGFTTAIEPALEIRDIDEASFKANPSESNRIWIGGRPVEQWLGARVGSTRCCSVCGESECRTVEIGAGTFEAIPQELFLKAALIASSELLEPQSGSAVA